MRCGSWMSACTLAVSVHARALALAEDREHVHITWISPESASNYGPGENIVASWSTPSTQARTYAWALQLCYTGGDYRDQGCESVAWMNVDRDGDIYQASM